MADEILERLAEGESIRSICRDEHLPSARTFHEWVIKHKDLYDRYHRAREIQSDQLVDEILEIADDATNDWMESNNPDDPGWKANGEAMARSRLRVDARKWYASKMAPKKYGERLQQDVTAVVRVEEIIVRIVDPKAPSEPLQIEDHSV